MKPIAILMAVLVVVLCGCNSEYANQLYKENQRLATLTTSLVMENERLIDEADFERKRAESFFMAANKKDLNDLLFVLQNSDGAEFKKEYARHGITVYLRTGNHKTNPFYSPMRYAWILSVKNPRGVSDSTLRFSGETTQEILSSARKKMECLSE